MAGGDREMSPQDGPDGGDFRPDDKFPHDMITMNPPRGPRWHPRRPVTVAAVAVVALAGGGGVGYAATHSLAPKASDTAAVATSPSTTTPSPSPSPGGKQGAGHGWRSFAGGFPFGGGLGPGGGVAHGQLTVPKSGGGYQTVDVQSGTVTAVSSSSVTVKSADGFTASYAVTSNTVVDAKSAGIGSVKDGDTVFVTATVSGSTATAANIVDVTAVQAGRATFGFRKPPAPPTPGASSSS
jgi:hypothetical protein